MLGSDAAGGAGMPRHALANLPPCPHEDVIAGACRCPDRAGWACDRYFCLCPERNLDPGRA